MNNILAGRRILVVEDEMMVLMVMEDMLARLGCVAVSAAATVDQALALIKTTDFDAAMLDINLNGSKSYPVADALVARGVPFAFSTGYSSHGMREDYRESPVLRKPYQHADVAAIFERLLWAGPPVAPMPAQV